MTARFTISKLGAQGDGIAETGSAQLFVPFALPGETVMAVPTRDRADLISVIEASPDRIEPACRHFGECGGCVMQHLAGAKYRQWKLQKLADALKGRGFDPGLVGEMISCAPASRRRVVFSARRSENGMLLGYNRALSHTLIDIAECPVAVPDIVAALPLLRDAAGLICATQQAFHLTVTATDTGLDLADTGSGALSDKARRMAAGFVMQAWADPGRGRIARLSVDGEVIVEPAKPIIRFGAATVTPPPGGFVQAVAAAEQAMAEIAATHLRRAKKIADLFAGAGAFALRLAANAEVQAVEGDAASLAALDRGFRFAPGLKRVTCEKRDLFRRPLTAKELSAFDGVLFDPPRAGAEDQSKQIARSDVPFVVAVSCNPVTLARDLRILADGGYALKSVVPIDQFLWSPHLEAVALLEKPKRRR